MIARLTTPIDVRCRPAIFLGYIADSDITWHGIDPKPEMVDEGRRVAAQLHRAGSHVRLGSFLDNHAPPPVREKVDRKSLLTASRATEDPRGWQGMVTPSAATVVRGCTS